MEQWLFNILSDPDKTAKNEFCMDDGKSSTQILGGDTSTTC